MHNAVAHHLLTNVQLAPEQKLPPPSQLPPNFIVQHNDIWYERSLQPFVSAVLVTLPPSCLSTPSLLAGRAA